jgi:colanic acid/amylovoran biosynthesis glycosyltransferase
MQAARFVEKKGVDLSIRAFAAAQTRLGPSELWLVGDGESRRELEMLADRVGVASKVRFLGMISHEDYRLVLPRVHVCLQPSRTASDGDSEGGAPTVLLEMQARGIPLVTTRHADIPFVVPPGTELVDEGDVDGLADALVHLSSASEDEWSKAAERGRTLVAANHDARKVAEQIEGLYKEALADG